MKHGGLEATMEAEEHDKDKKPDEYQLDNHVRTLIDAEKIKSDPKLMKHVGPHMEKHKAAVNKIDSLDKLKAVAKKKMSEPDPV